MASNIGAFLDIDGTLARTSLMIAHFKKLIKFGLIKQSEWIEKIQPIYDEYDKRYEQYDNYLLVLAEVYKHNLIGINKEFNQHIAKLVVNTAGDIVYRYTRDRIAYHKKNNHLTFFVSGSPDFLVKEMADRYNVTEYRGSVYTTDEFGHYTGEVYQMWDSENKKKVIDEIIQKYDIDTDKSYAYGDTSGDFTMLKQMKHSVAINPTMELINMINDDDEMKDRLDIIVERKDVIYSLKSDVKRIIITE